VLTRQLQWREPLAPREEPLAVVLGTDVSPGELDVRCGGLAARMRAEAPLRG
jgi:hypothetical protein